MKCHTILAFCFIAAAFFMVSYLMWDIYNERSAINLVNRTSTNNESDAMLTSNLNRTERWISQNIQDVPGVKRTRRHLEKMLGMAFNSQFMSIHKPLDFTRNELQEEDTNFMNLSDAREVDLYKNGLPDPIARTSFINSRFKREVTEAPVNVSESDDVEAKNSTSEPRNILPWTCPSYNQWVDMGEDTFPRYMRSVTCSSKSCWFDRMSCQPKSFAVVVLRRKRSRSRINAEEIEKIFPLLRKKGSNNLPIELREEWEMEERSANFCCECVFPSLE